MIKLFRYDKNNQKTEEIWPDGSKTTHQYDANGNLTQQTDRKGQIIAYQYNSANQPRPTASPTNTMPEAEKPRSPPTSVPSAKLKPSPTPCAGFSEQADKAAQD
ncbi:hypothetical protein [Thiolapillus sp.]